MTTAELIRDRSICTRRERRYTTSADKLLRCETTVQGEEMRLGHVVDVSRLGIRLLCEGHFQVGQTIQTQLVTDRPHGVYPGVVRRVEPWVDGQSILGCSLDDAIPDSILEDLAAEGIVNRRSDDRYTVQRTAAISWQLHLGEVEVEIKDYSFGGLRAESPQSIPTDARLRIRIELSDEELVLDGKSVWQRESAEGYLSGIAFTDRHAPAKVSRLEPTKQDDLTSEPTLSSRFGSVRRVFVVVAGVATACYALTLI